MVVQSYMIEVPPIGTSTKPRKFKLLVEATGPEHECRWLQEHINRILEREGEINE